ncbi:MAG: flavin reductase family protein [Cyclobacteriaceae bacterium]|nr:flavin reductase family protein [Cyclobacteriaceae bacterium]
MNSLRKKPWNRVDHPVYSISSMANGKANMNICTYAIPVSMHPKRYVVAIYKNTRTLENVQKNPEFVLQILAQHHDRLVTLLGKKSGNDIDKIKRLKEPVGQFHTFTFLSTCLAIIHLKVIQWMDGGDHLCALCDVVGYKNLTDNTPLTLGFLRKKKIIVG